MNRIILLFITLWAGWGLSVAQTLHVETGNVTYDIPSSQAGDMPFLNTNSVRIMGKSYSLSDINRMYVDYEAIGDSAVNITYSGNKASVRVGGAISRYLSIAVDGANVSIVADKELQSKVTYTLQGSSTNGSFYMDGSFASNLVLSNLSLASSDSAAIKIDNGKRINVTLVGNSTLQDAESGSQKACFYINGHAVISGSGVLNITGNASHAYYSDEYTRIESGTVTVASAKNDGFHISQYFRMDGGEINISSQGDGIDVGFKGVNKGTKDSYSNNGWMLLNGGTINISTTGVASKGLKADSTVVCSGTNVTSVTTGNAYYDTDKLDISSCSALKTGGDFMMNNGTLSLSSSGSGGKGANADGNITISGGTIYVTTTGSTFVYEVDDSKPQGMKCDGELSITGGNVYVAASSASATAFKPKGNFTVSGGTLMGIGNKKSEPTAGTQNYYTYKDVVITGGQTITYNGVSYTVPNNYTNSSAKILVSSPAM